VYMFMFVDMYVMYTRDLSMRASSSFSVGRKLRNFGSVISGGSMQINNSMVKDGRYCVCVCVCVCA